MDDNRSRILACALDLFAARGYDAVGVQEVADAAGLKKPTLYHYFGSKRGLLETLLNENFVELFDSLESAAVYHRDVKTSLSAMAIEYFRFAEKHQKFYRMQLSMWFAPPESTAFAAISAVNQKQQLLLETFFMRASEDHGNMKERQRAYAATFLGMLNTYISISLNGFTNLDENLAQNAVHQFMHGIFS
ncbi:MAG: helix-turn-helix domain containing protein [Chloroflexi bacterium]|nr:helix-turn-helix domain containing protein [Chloroflexota bacterium]